LLHFPVDLPEGAILTGVDALVQTTVDPGAGNRIKLHLYRMECNYAAPGSTNFSVATVESAAGIVVRKVSLTGLTELIYSPGSGVAPQKAWMVSIETSTNIPAFGVANAVFGVRLTYTL